MIISYVYIYIYIYSHRIHPKSAENTLAQWPALTMHKTYKNYVLNLVKIMNPKSSKIYGKATCRRFWLVKAHHFSHHYGCSSGHRVRNASVAPWSAMGHLTPKLWRNNMHKIEKSSWSPIKTCRERARRQKVLGPLLVVEKCWKYLSSNLKNTNYWINLNHTSLTQVVLYPSQHIAGRLFTAPFGHT